MIRHHHTPAELPTTSRPRGITLHNTDTHARSNQGKTQSLFV